jgi:nucleoside-diphosphate-sugar epimerase
MIFVLGGRGLVGSAFVRVCGQRGLPCVAITRENYAELAGKRCEVFVNANGNSSKLLSRTDPLRDFDASVRSVRASLADFRFDRYVHLSSCDVYPDCASPATTEESRPLDPVRQSPYGFHKYLAEECVRHGAGRWTIFRLGGFVGPGLKKNAIYDILHGGPLWLDPDSALQFLHTDRAAEIMLDVNAPNEILNLCGRGVIQLSEVLGMVEGAVPVQPDSPTVRYEVSIEKILRLTDVPETRTAVREFVHSEVANAGR